MLDNVLTLQLLGAVASAKMAVVQKICISSLGLVTVLIQPLWPAFADAAAREDRHWLFNALGRGSALVAFVSTSGSALLVVFGLPFLHLWLKTDIGIDQSLIWVIAGWIVSLSLVRVQIMLLNALQIVKFQIAVFALATTVAVCLKFILAPRLGVAGILIATAITFPVIILPAVLWRTNRWRRHSASSDGPIEHPA
jgi:O-antigen/teichoic acid export membrane protein